MKKNMRETTPTTTAADRAANSHAGGRSRSPRPVIDAIVVVEGVNDARAVRAAVNPLGGTMLLKGRYDSKMGHHTVPSDVSREVAAAAAAAAAAEGRGNGNGNGKGDATGSTGTNPPPPPPPRVIVLTDSDTAGRQMRSRLVQDAPGALHAFIGAHESSATKETEWHKVGNVGVEHAVGTHSYRSSTLVHSFHSINYRTVVLSTRHI